MVPRWAGLRVSPTPTFPAPQQLQEPEEQWPWRQPERWLRLIQRENRKKDLEKKLWHLITWNCIFGSTDNTNKQMWGKFHSEPLSCGVGGWWAVIDCNLLYWIYGAVASVWCLCDFSAALSRGALLQLMQLLPIFTLRCLSHKGWKGHNLRRTIITSQLFIETGNRSWPPWQKLRQKTTCFFFLISSFRLQYALLIFCQGFFYVYLPIFTFQVSHC